MTQQEAVGRIESEEQLAERRRQLAVEVEAVFEEWEWGPLDPRVRDALLAVPRHRHVPPGLFEMAYEDRVVDLDPQENLEQFGRILTERGLDFRKLSWDEILRIFSIFEPSIVSTSSAPSIVALMTQAVLPEAFSEGEQARQLKALDIGAGLGYQTAMLRVAGFSKVYGVEIKPHLVLAAREIFEEIGDDAVQFFCLDGKLGLPFYKPYDAIVVAAAASGHEVVETLMRQLKVGGKMVIPEVVGYGEKEEIEIAGMKIEHQERIQELRVYSKTEKGMTCQDLSMVSFVDLR